MIPFLWIRDDASVLGTAAGTAGALALGLVEAAHVDVRAREHGLIDH